MLALAWLVASLAVHTAALPAGQIVDEVVCTDDRSHSYALYLPSNYTASRTWPIIIAFDPGARGRVPVERYQAAAERFGFIVVGSNNARNGYTQFPRTLAALTADVSMRFAIEPKRVYLAGMSGGARTALGVALASKNIAGVIASSAGYPEPVQHKVLSFPLFATAGTDDFNHLEMRRLDRALTSPHRLVIFNGGHVWLSSELAVEAVAWMELQAMKTGLTSRNDREIGRQFAARKASVNVTVRDRSTLLALQSIVDDFQGLVDVSDLVKQADELRRDAAVRAGLKKDLDDERREEKLLRDMTATAARLASDDRQRALVELRRHWQDLSAQALAPTDSTDRQLARRVLAALSADGTKDEEYARIISDYRAAISPQRR